MAWSKVQSFLKNTDYASPEVLNSAVTLGSSVSAGHVIFVQCTAGCDPTIPGSQGSVTDSLGNTYNPRTAAQGGRLFDSGHGQGTEYFYCVVTTGGTPTITYTPNGGASANFIAFQGDHFSGSDSGSTVRDSQGQLQTTPGGSTDAIRSSGSNLTAQSGDLIWAASGDPGTGGTGSEVIGTGFSAGSTIDSTTGFITEYKTATGNQLATFTDGSNGAGNNYYTFSISISPAGGGGDATVNPTGVSAAFSVGTPSISAGNTQSPTGFGLSFGLGVPSVNTGANINVNPLGLSMTFAIGTFTIQNDINMLALGTTIAMALGSPAVSIQSNPVNVNITPTGVTMAFTVGTPTFILSSNKSVTGVSMGLTLGVPTVTGTTSGPPSSGAGAVGPTIKRASFYG